MTTIDVTWLNTHSMSKEFFRLPQNYANALGGLRWSDQFDWLVLPGETKITYEELAQFFEGFASRRVLLTFGSMAHWVVLIQAESADPALGRLRTLFQETGRNWRNAGALAGMMSTPLLAAAHAPPADVLCARLRESAFPLRWFSGLFNQTTPGGEEPPHAFVEFEQHLRHGLAQLTDADLVMWLKSGRGPLVRAGAELARAQPPPRVLGSVLDELFTRPRLAGAAPYVPQMVAAFSVPPRRHAPEQLPIGGYSDVVTHGSLDRLLPSQHALDDLEFLRRHCENELFYFRREEPPAHTRHEMVLILDQGVRTWGDVRLVLTAATLALAQHAGRKKLAHYLAMTSRPGLLPNAFAEPSADLGAALEASDFTTHPGLPLESVLERPGATPRDIFLLTHPYSLLEDGVRNAARRLLPRDRLFALTVNDKGDAELAELRHGAPVRLKSFHVDFVPTKTPAAQPAQTASSWSGAVEPIDWPFRFGVDAGIHRFVFSHSGSFLCAVTTSSMIFAWNLLNGDMEILPRPQTRHGRVTDWRDITGVPDGFVFLATESSHYVVVHYDWIKKTCTAYDTTIPATEPVSLTYVPEWDTAVLLLVQIPYLAIDLAERTIAYSRDIKKEALGTVGFVVNVGMDPQQIPKAAKHSGRAEQALLRVEQLGDRADYTRAHVAADGSLSISVHGKRWPAVFPVKDGRKILTNYNFQGFKVAEKTLAIQYAIPEKSTAYKHVLAFYRTPDAHFLREIHWTSPVAGPSPFVLSRDGTKFALQRSDRILEVQYTDRPERILYTRYGRFSVPSRLWVTHDGLLLCCGRRKRGWHLLIWSKKSLEVHSEMGGVEKKLSAHSFRDPQIREFVVRCEPEETITDSVRHLDEPKRWIGGLNRNGALFALDRYGQVVVFDATKNVVFQFFAHGDSWSAWLPDGTRHGHGPVHHWRNTPGALTKMAQALCEATGGSRR